LANTTSNNLQSTFGEQKLARTSATTKEELKREVGENMEVDFGGNMLRTREATKRCNSERR
jgi:hypothetical protein